MSDTISRLRIRRQQASSESGGWAVIGRLLCWLGMHSDEWLRYSGWGALHVRGCKRCGLEWFSRVGL